ncbi:MAG: hypothetical protein GWM92_05760 [Gemmatimonadetes bacterium]|nr:hypothetical protein [Gemmatimonadota bacterium]NIR78095.1 hypothetical protein [Gemmatimonadota bacterium]NIT86665.1 hypothetical protein [Gemmatimonadota bacterium]NIU30515.1 hypothetical protein [Gemmatimonadota bacterium]NIU35357.1 hypothetical protein [Gemmatimonadota bacterium]
MATLRDRITEIHDHVRRIRDTRRQVRGVVEHLAALRDSVPPGIRDAASALEEQLDEAEARLIQTAPGLPVASEPRLSSRFAWLADQVTSSDHRPTDQALERAEALEGELTPVLYEVNRLMEEDVAAFNRRLRDAGVPAVVAGGR